LGQLHATQIIGAAHKIFNVNKKELDIPWHHMQTKRQDEGKPKKDCTFPISF
jgi:hypothetical protein